MKKYVILLVIILTGHFSYGFFSNNGDHTLDTGEGAVRLISKSEGDFDGFSFSLYLFEVESHGISARQVTVRAFHRENSRGAVVLNTGGPGRNYYGFRSEEATSTIKVLYENGLEVYEVKWEGDMGWATHARGLGFHIAVGAFTEVVKHLHQNYFDNPDMVFAHGNSGGAFQIAYGLAMYKLDEYVNMVILTGGPPVSDLKTGIFGKGNEPIYWPFRLGGRGFTDYIMGWDGNGDYCVNGKAPRRIRNQLDTVSLVTSKHPRVYEYKTFVNFVQSDDPSNAHTQARLYYDVITSGKSFYYFPEVKTHNVPASIEGAGKIRELILEFL